jgi:hypothetical protein
LYLNPNHLQVLVEQRIWRNWDEPRKPPRQPKPLEQLSRPDRRKALAEFPLENPADVALYREGLESWRAVDQADAGRGRQAYREFPSKGMARPAEKGLPRSSVDLASIQPKPHI